MNALIVRALAQAGPSLGRLVASRPGLLGQIVSVLRKGSKFAGSSVTDVIRFASSNKTAAIFTLSSLASLGVSIADLFSDSQDFEKLQRSGVDDESMSFLRDLMDVARAGSDSLDAASLKQQLVAADDVVNYDSNLADNRESLEFATSTLRWSVAFYGSREAALEAHIKQQAFFGMASKDVAAGLKLLRL